MVLNTLWTQIEVVELTNDGSGLGFGISGNKSTGVVVKAIVPGSIADKDGRIHTGDHLFQINHVYVRGMSSEQVAGILRQCSQEVRLVVARSVREPPPSSSSPSLSQRSSVTSENLPRAKPSPLTTLMDNEGVINNSQKKIFLRTERLLESNHNLEKILDHLLEQCQNEDGTEILDVTLEKGDDGLGITVAGYVSPDSTNNDAIAGIFIRDIADGSVSSRDGRLAIGDQIIEVNDQSLNGFSNVQALYLLQNTSSSVCLKVRRYLDGSKYDKIREMIALESSSQHEEKIELQSETDLNEQILQKWTKIFGNHADILIIDVVKPDYGTLGITLEGTIDVESGEEIGSHHYIRAVLKDGVIGMQGSLQPGDELLEINNQTLYGKDHIQVIEILKRIKYQIKLVCARRRTTPSTAQNSINGSIRSRSISFGKTTEIAVKAKSTGKLDAMEHYTSRINKSRSLEVISDLALWSKSVLDVELNKDENGLGFSVLDYQDPSNPSCSPVIVIRSLVSGGVAQTDGRIVPGDRLVAVNGIALENITLNDVIRVLKSTPKGPVKLSLAKPLPYPKFKGDNDDRIVTDSDQDANSIRRLSRFDKSLMSTKPSDPSKLSNSARRKKQRKAGVSLGIALSAPAILVRHDYSPPLLNKEVLKKQLEQRASSAGRRSKPPSKKSRSSKKAFDKTRSVSSSSSSDMNLPEFVGFHSDHIVLSPKLGKKSSSDRSRASANHSTSKFHRSSLNNNTLTKSTSNPIKAGTLNSNKRQSRSRHSHEINLHPDKQQSPNQQRAVILEKFDSMSCFKEPDLSSDDNHNNLPQSSSLTSQPPIQSSSQRSIVTDDDASEILQIMDPKSQKSPKDSPIMTTGSTEMSKYTVSSKQSSSMTSPVQSTNTPSSEVLSLKADQEAFPPLPVHPEHQLIIKTNDFKQLNLLVDAAIDGGINGCYVRSIAQTPFCTQIKPGYFITSINNENMREINNNQAREIIERASLIGSDISVIFISDDEARNYKANLCNLTSTATNDEMDPSIKMSSNDVRAMEENNEPLDDPIDTETLCSTLWGPPRTVVLYRNEQARSLGISIVGGKLDFSGPGNTIETCISGIFVKHVIPDSPAGRYSTLKTGDRILEVNGYNLRDATHDHAVEVIRAAQSPVYFIVQSLLDPSNSTATALAHSDAQNTEEDPIIKQYRHLDGQILIIDIRRIDNEINEPLGLSLIGHRDIDKLAVFVCDVQPDSLIARDNRMRVGDQLLQVNDEVLLGKPHAIVTSVIKSIKSEILRFVVLRKPESIHQMALRNPYPFFYSHPEKNIIAKQSNDPKESNNKDHQSILVSDVPVAKQTTDVKTSNATKTTSNPIKASNNLEHDDQNVTTNKDDIQSPNPDHNSILSSPENRELLSKALSSLTNTDNQKSETTKTTGSRRSFSAHRYDENNRVNEPAVSHMPLVSSSSSSSSLSVQSPTVYAKPPPCDEPKPKSVSFNEVPLIEDDPRTRPIIVGKETLIELDRGQHGLGLSVVGGADTQLSSIIIHDIYPSCAAYTDGRLMVGDHILQVNSTNLRSATHEEAIQALRQSSNTIRLVVLRRDLNKEEEKFEIISIDLTKRSGKGLGFSIIGRRNGCGVFISHIIEGSSAEKDGRLMSGDLIVEVNGKDLRAAAYEQVAQTLKKLPHGRVEIKVGRLKTNLQENCNLNRTQLAHDPAIPH